MDKPNPGLKRVTVRPKCPNPLFENWLEEWKEEAASKGSDMQYCFGKALKSLRKYPLLLKCGKECLVLEAFGERLCQLLDRKLIEYRKTHPEGETKEAVSSVPSLVIESKSKRSQTKQRVTSNTSKTKGTVPAVEDLPSKETTMKRGSVREYVPTWRSGPYAILLTLLRQESKPDYCGYMTKADLQREAQPLSDTSFTRPDPGSHYTAWSSTSQLIKKGLLNKFSNPAKFNLTDEGREMAKRLLESSEEPKNHEGSGESLPAKMAKLYSSPVTCEGTSTKAMLVPKDNTSEKRGIPVTEYGKVISTLQTASSSPFKNPTTKTTSNLLAKTCVTEDMIVLHQGQFDIFLLVDTAETTGTSKKRHDQTLSELTQMKVPHEVRNLKVGDFAWIARHHTSGDELLLPYIVERKRMDDFGGSIKDGRFREQKFRLKQSGVGHLIYLVESYGSDQHVGLPLSSIQQAAVNTQINEEFFVKHTTDHLHSMAYLASLTRLIGRVFLNKTLMSCSKKDLRPVNLDSDFSMLMTFKEFSQTTAKTRNFTVREMFIRQLLQLKGLSVEKALAIVGRYPTPQALVSAYREGGDQLMLASIPYGTANRNIGPVVSTAIYQLYTKRKL